MTWEEFVKEVERQMEEGNIPKDTRIWYIDISHPDVGGSLLVMDNSIGITIS